MAQHIRILILLLVYSQQGLSITVYNIVNNIFCGNGVPMFDAALLQISFSGNVPANVSCAIGLMSFEKEKMVAVVEDFNTDISPNNTCLSNRLDIFNGVYKNVTGNRTNIISGQRGLCGKVPANTNYVAPSPNITFLFKTYYKPQIGNFRIVVTPFSDGPCNNSLDFQCDNGRCINKRYKCDFYNNCGDNSDETVCTTVTSVTLSAGEIVAILLGIIVLIILLPGFLIYSLSRKRRYAKL